MADSDDGAAAPPPRGGVLARVGSKLSSAASATRESLDSAGDALSRGVARADAWAAAGWVGRAFAFRERRARLSTELRAGLVTFLMVAYVLAVIPQVLGSTGGPCDAEAICGPRAYDALGHDCLFVSPEGLACVERVRASLITATTVTSLVACFLLGYFANLPLALAPGLGGRWAPPPRV
jgi:AGZA family xanthine/uracil permease-like MFS transporter